jgi:hypothetical protein
MNNIPKQKINTMKIDIENDNNNPNPNQFSYKKINKKINKEKIERNENKIKNNNINENKEINIETNNNTDEYYNTINNSHRKFIKNINQNDSSGVSSLLKINNNYENKIEREKTPLTSNNNKKRLFKQRTNYNNYNNNDFNYTNINIPSHKNEESLNPNEYTNYRNSTKSNINSNKKGKIARTKSIDSKISQNSNYIKIKNKNNQMTLFPSESNLKIEKKLEEIAKILIQLQKKRDVYLDEYDKLPEHPKKQKDLIDKRETKKIIDELNTAINEYKMKERNLRKMYQPV